ncbi:hypothetical protein NDN08_000785 [Rhodosorus marinus]|uniref:RRM domain-containing protein n=2 Tax=Rhodosorus marinus TaxID=101924 RepID=A0AAV8US08_9RHOD|nr:hypothetical protein NDN08_000785 [Rhodosorus marinus]
MAYDPYGCSLYVGNLDARVCTELLEEIFNLAGEVKLCKVVGDKNTGHSLGFGFVDFANRQTASSALEKFNGRIVYGQEIRVDWAHTGTGAAGKFINPNQEDISGHYCLFIGNLSSDVEDQMLFDAFAAFGSCSSAKVSRDPETQRVSGYGFVSFRERKDAESAIEGLNGQTVGQRQIRVDWARTKTNAATRAAAMGLPEPPRGEDGKREPLDYEAILRQADPQNITVYISGLPSNCEEQSLMEIMREFGTVEDLRIPESSRNSAMDKAYAFVKYRTHEEAAGAIHACQSKEFNGKPMSVTWGRESMRSRGPRHHHNNYHQNPSPYGMQPFPGQPGPGFGPPQGGNPYGQNYGYQGGYKQNAPPNPVRGSPHFAPRQAPY